MECHSAYLANIEYLRGLAAHRPAAVFTPSEAQRRLVLERVGTGIAVRVVPNPLREEFVAEPPPFPAPPPRPVIAWIGRLDDHKNWRGFVEIAGLLGRRGAGHEAWIIGKPIEADGPARLLEAAREEKVLRRLRWFGALPYGRIPTFLDAVRESGGVVVSTSRGESFGLTIAEAMARRCAVAAPGPQRLPRVRRAREDRRPLHPRLGRQRRRPHPGAARRRRTPRRPGGAGAGVGAGEVRARAGAGGAGGGAAAARGRGAQCPQTPPLETAVTTPFSASIFF